MNGSCGAETRVNVEFEIASNDNVRGAVPVLLMFSVISAVWPTVTVPKFRLVVETAIFGTAAEMPVPVSVTAILGFKGSLLEIVSVPGWGPDVVGLNVTVSVALAPAAIGATDVGETVNGPLTLTVMFNGAVPLLRTVTTRSAVCPTVRPPKSEEAGVTAICGAAGGPPMGAPLEGSAR